MSFRNESQRKFVAIFEQFATFPYIEVDEGFENFRRKLREFSERLDAIRSDDSISSRMRTSIARESWEASQWYTHKSFFDPNSYGLRAFKGLTLQQKFFDALSSLSLLHDPDSFLEA